jgi:UDP-N-acetylglucosamine 3-dehydrogenase
MKKIETSDPIKLVFLGCGLATEIHSKTLRSFNDVRRYYASRDEAKSKSYNEKFKGHGYFGSYDDAIHAPDIDVVLVATPPVSHLDLALKALKAGKHVIVEKPPFLKSSDFDIVEKACQENDSQLMVAENYFYKPLAARLRQIVGNNEIGDILFVHVNALKLQKTGNWRDDPKLSGYGALFEGGIHWMNFMGNIGLTVRSVKGFQPLLTADPERSMIVGFDYEEGSVGALYHSWEIPSLFKGLRISRIHGREGSITFESNGIFILVKGRRKRFVFPGIKDISGYRGMFTDFLRALRSGSEPEYNLARARKDIKFIEAAYESAKGGK